MNELQKEKRPIKAGYRDFYTQDDSGKTFVFAVLAPIALSLLLVIIASAFVSGDDLTSVSSSNIFLVASSLCGQLCFLGIFFFYNKSQKITFSAARLSFSKTETKMGTHFGTKTVLLCVAIGVVMLFCLEPLVTCLDKLFEVTGYSFSSSSLPVDTWGWYIADIFLLAVMPAVCEELVFRGIILNGLRKNFSDKVAILLSALAFMLMHGNPQQVLYPLVMGLVLGFVATRTGSTISSMVVHFASNFVVITASFVAQMTGFELFTFVGEWWFYVLVVALLVVAFAFLYLVDRFAFKRKNTEEIVKTPNKSVSVFYLLGAFIGLVLLISAFITGYTS